MVTIRCASGSAVKLNAIKKAWASLRLQEKLKVVGLPVELQDRPDFDVNAQPEGREQTITYARHRMQEMHRQHGGPIGVDISIESGAIEGVDVAVVLLCSPDGKEAIAFSSGIAFPQGTLEEARRRGFKATTAGDIIHERFPEVPANNWQAHFPPHTSREDQIAEALKDGLLTLQAKRGE